MATPAAVNCWLDELSTALLSTNSTISSKQRKRLQDNFRRRVKRHNNARTNQFEVAEHLDGLEEKFQILTLDNLADALRLRRNELKEFEHHWLPDVLDLLLHLSGDPARNERLLELYRVPPRIGTPPPLRWKDLLANDPIDQQQRLWRVPDFRDTDDSGYDDDDFLSSNTSPQSVKHKNENNLEELLGKGGDLLYTPDIDDAHVSYVNASLIPENGLITEEEFIKEALFMLRTLPTKIFPSESSHLQLKNFVRIRGLSQLSLEAASQRLVQIHEMVRSVRQWISSYSKETYINAMKNAAEKVVRDFCRSIDDFQQELLTPGRDTIVSIIRCMKIFEDNAVEISAIAQFLSDAQGGDTVFKLEKLFEATQFSQLTGQTRAYQCLSALLLPSLRAYLLPVQRWVGCGELFDESAGFFIKETGKKAMLSRLWHDAYELQMTGMNRPPAFLRDTAGHILTCGKTSAFLSKLGCDLDGDVGKSGCVEDLLSMKRAKTTLPFGAVFENNWRQAVIHLLELRTQKLKHILATHCCVEDTLDALEQIYLGHHFAKLGEIEEKLLDRIDRCMDNWNDRFQLRDMLEEALGRGNGHRISDAITIHSVYTSSRSMQNRRSSVKILSALSIEYMLPWPLANIIEGTSMIAYRRVSLMLMQIRRAKYCIERTGYLSAMTVPLGDDTGPVEQKYAQTLAFKLLNFVNTLSDHLMATTIRPLTMTMRENIRAAATVDELIEVHKTYIRRLDSSCLAAPKIKILRQSLIAMLDLCIRFSDLVSNPAKAQSAEADHETSSFASARSRSHTPTAHQYGSDDDDDYEKSGEGYSSFIVLADDTSIFKELKKVQAQFDKQLRFFVAALRGVGRAGQHVRDLEQLADRLAWTLLR